MLWRNWVLFNGTDGSRKGEKICKMTQEVGSQNAKDRCKCGHSTNKWWINSVTWKCWQGYGNLFGGKGPNSGLTSGFSTMTMPLCMMGFGARKFMANKSITKMDHSPYSSDLATCDFWLFPKLKNDLKGHLPTFLISNATWCYCEVFQKMILKTPSGSVVFT
jgi:hypothetical protein